MSDQILQVILETWWYEQTKYNDELGLLMDKRKKLEKCGFLQLKGLFDSSWKLQHACKVIMLTLRDSTKIINLLMVFKEHIVKKRVSF